MLHSFPWKKMMGCSVCKHKTHAIIYRTKMQSMKRVRQTLHKSKSCYFNCSKPNLAWKSRSVWNCHRHVLGSSIGDATKRTESDTRPPGSYTRVAHPAELPAAARLQLFGVIHRGLTARIIGSEAPFPFCWRSAKCSGWWSHPSCTSTTIRQRKQAAKCSLVDVIAVKQKPTTDNVSEGDM